MMLPDLTDNMTICLSKIISKAAKLEINERRRSDPSENVSMVPVIVTTTAG
jgi:hypothetical protein